MGGGASGRSAELKMAREIARREQLKALLTGSIEPLGENYVLTIQAINAESGKLAWHFQGVHHGLWDYDFPAAPTLVDINVDGKRIKAVAQVSKQGFTYVFDRATGKPVWQTEVSDSMPLDAGMGSALMYGEMIHRNLVDGRVSALAAARGEPGGGP